MRKCVFPHTSRITQGTPMATSTSTPDQATQRRYRRAGRWQLGETAIAYLMNGPALVIILALTIYPILNSFWLSLHQYSLRRPDSVPFVGLGNYWQLLQQKEFWHSLQVTLTFTFWQTLIVLVLSIGISLVLNEPFHGRGFVRALVLLPWAIPGVVSALMWRWVFNGQIGILNGALYSLGIIDDYHSWLIDERTTYPSLIFADVWNTFPFSTLIMLAALQAIPGELYDAARVDRAGVWNRFRHVTLPWLTHPILIVLILQTLSGLRLFDLIYLLTGGGPGDATTTLGYLVYQTSFLSYDFGMGNAYAYVMALLTLVLAILYMKLLWRRGDIKT
jgi:multiple sugar transport system permease protein